ncbi:unnamed protein product, partial [Laminaria digitata]
RRSGDDTQSKQRSGRYLSRRSLEHLHTIDRGDREKTPPATPSAQYPPGMFASLHAYRSSHVSHLMCRISCVTSRQSTVEPLGKTRFSRTPAKWGHGLAQH